MIFDHNFVIYTVFLQGIRIWGQIWNFGARRGKTKKNKVLFVTNKFKIKEPSNIKKVVSTDIFLVPGLAFSRAGVRLGRGKGLYDKLLSKYSSSIKIGICSSKNLLDEIPKEEHDICMDYIFTENEYLKIH